MNFVQYYINILYNSFTITLGGACDMFRTCRWRRVKVRDLFLGLREQQSEALVLLYPCGKAALALLPRALHLLLQLPQHPQLLVQPAVACPRRLQLQFQV